VKYLTGGCWKKTYTPLQLTGWRRPRSGRPWTAHTAENVILLMTPCSVRKVHHRHQSILEISRYNGSICH